MKVAVRGCSFARCAERTASGTPPRAFQTFPSLPPNTSDMMSATCSGGTASVNISRACPTSPRRFAPAENSDVNSSTSDSSAAIDTAPSCAAARVTSRNSCGSKCFSRRVAGGLPIASRIAAAFCAPANLRASSGESAAVSVFIAFRLPTRRDRRAKRRRSRSGRRRTERSLHRRPPLRPARSPCR